MIVKIKEIGRLHELCNLYKKNYIPLISKFTKIYSYTIKNNYVAFIVFDIIYDRCEIIDLFVLDEYRNKGIATKMLKEIENNFDIKNITLEVKETNKIAIKLYENFGFKKVSIRKKYYDGIDGFLMLKEVR